MTIWEGPKDHNDWHHSPETRTLQRWMHWVCRKSWPQRFRTARNALGEVAQDPGSLCTVAIPPFMVSTQGLGYWTRGWCRILQVPAKHFPALHKMPTLIASLSYSHSSYKSIRSDPINVTRNSAPRASFNTETQSCTQSLNSSSSSPLWTHRHFWSMLWNSCAPTNHLQNYHLLLWMLQNWNSSLWWEYCFCWYPIKWRKLHLPQTFSLSSIFGCFFLPYSSVTSGQLLLLFSPQFCLVLWSLYH